MQKHRMSNVVHALVQTPAGWVLSSRRVHSGVRELALSSRLFLSHSNVWEGRLTFQI